jgi:hypothetical protein
VPSWTRRHTNGENVEKDGRGCRSDGSHFIAVWVSSQSAITSACCQINEAVTETFAVCDRTMVNASMAVSKTSKMSAAPVSHDLLTCILLFDSAEGVAEVVLAHELKMEFAGLLAFRVPCPKVRHVRNLPEF